MNAFLGKHSVITLLLVLILFATAWLLTSNEIKILLIFLILGGAINGFVIVKKHREAYLHNQISHLAFRRNVHFEIIGVVLAMILAGLLGRTIAEIATRQISHDLVKLVTGIMIGLMIGVIVGASMKHMSSYILKCSSAKTK